MLIYREASIHDAEAIARTEVASKEVSLVGVIEFMAPEYELDYGRLLEKWKGYIEKTRNPSQSKDPRVIYAALDGTLMVGYTACHHTTKWGVEGELQSMYVLKDYQGQGIGTHLFELVVNWVRGGGIYSMGVNLYSENPYRRFYEKMGGEYLRPSALLWKDLKNWTLLPARGLIDGQ